MKIKFLFLISFIIIISCNETQIKPTNVKIIQEQDSLLKTLDEQDSIVIINNDSQKVRKVLPDAN